MTAPSNLRPDERALWEAEARMTPGEWENDSDNIFVGTPLPNSPEAVKVLFEAGWGTNEDAHGIVLARNAICPLLTEIDRLRGALMRIMYGSNEEDYELPMREINKIAAEALEEKP